MEDKDLESLREAKQLLENPGVAARLTALIGTPIEKGFAMLPDGWNKQVGEVTQSALGKAIDAAVFTMKNRPREKASTKLHKLAVAASGGVGGFFGLPALAIELPVSTTIMLRSIIDIARAHGENIDSIETRLECLKVFAFGGPSSRDDESETGYFAVRASLARSVGEAVEYIAERGVAGEGAPLLVRLIAKIAERFGVQVSEKLAAQAVPAIGAVGGALVNTVFIDHFQDMARGHFTVRQLESKYGKDLVESTYRAI